MLENVYELVFLAIVVSLTRKRKVLYKPFLTLVLSIALEGDYWLAPS